LIAAGPLLEALPVGATVLILAGGLAYTAGAGFFLWERLPFNHVIWHGFVMAGSALHALAILGYVVLGA
jgi:hemolysin III